MTSANFKIVFWRGNVRTGTGNGNSHSFSLFLSGQENQQEKVSSLTFSLFILFRQSTLCNFEFVVFPVGSAETGTGNAKFFLLGFFRARKLARKSRRVSSLAFSFVYSEKLVK